MEVKTLKTKDGDIEINVYNAKETDIENNILDNTLDLTEMDLVYED